MTFQLYVSSIFAENILILYSIFFYYCSELKCIFSDIKRHYLCMCYLFDEALQKIYSNVNNYALMVFFMPLQCDLLRFIILKSLYLILYVLLSPTPKECSEKYNIFFSNI